MRDIARSVDMEAASLYNHISSKQEILRVIIMSIAERFTDGLEKISLSEVSPIQKLEAVIQQHVQMTIEHTDAIALIPSEWVHLKEPNLKKFVLLRDKYEKEFKSLMLDAIEAGEIGKVDPDLAVFTLLSTLRWLYSWYSKYRPEDTTGLKSKLTQYLLKGIVSR